jgi:hypothetical protein
MGVMRMGRGFFGGSGFIGICLNNLFETVGLIRLSIDNFQIVIIYPHLPNFIPLFTYFPVNCSVEERLDRPDKALVLGAEGQTRESGEQSVSK